MKMDPKIINQWNLSGWYFHDRHQLYLKDECCDKAGVMSRLIPDMKPGLRLSSLSEGDGGSANRKQAHKHTTSALRQLLSQAKIKYSKKQKTKQVYKIKPRNLSFVFEEVYSWTKLDLFLSSKEKKHSPASQGLSPAI